MKRSANQLTQIQFGLALPIGIGISSHCQRVVLFYARAYINYKYKRRAGGVPSPQASPTIHTSPPNYCITLLFIGSSSTALRLRRTFPSTPKFRLISSQPINRGLGGDVVVGGQTIRRKLNKRFCPRRRCTLLL